MGTVRLYKDDVYMRSCETQLTACRRDGDSLLMEFASTVFFPEGGGQSSDVGVVAIDGADYRISKVNEREGAIVHVSEAGDAAMPRIGATATLHIDWEHRFDNMQRHCGEHILSGIFYEKYGGVNRGFHMGEDYVAIDISLECNADYTELTPAMIAETELAANRVIWENLPVRTLYFDKKEEAAALPLRKELTVESDISVVVIGDEAHTVDCVACCGTHPAATGQVGLVKILKTERNKGMFRVYVEFGRRALLDYKKKHEIIAFLDNKYSTKTDDLLAQLANEERKSREARGELNRLKQSLIKSRAAETDEELMKMQTSGERRILIREYDDFSIEELLSIGKFIKSPIPVLLLLVCRPQNAVVLLSDGKTCDCGRLVKENAPIYNGKGGGRADNARALFNSEEYLDTFIDLLGKHLR